MTIKNNLIVKFSLVVVIGYVCILSWYSYLYWVDFENRRLHFEQRVAIGVLESLREPLLMGSFVETRRRAAKWIGVESILCIEISVGTELLVSCDFKKKPNYTELSMPIYYADSGGVVLANVRFLVDQTFLVKQYIGGTLSFSVPKFNPQVHAIPLGKNFPKTKFLL